MPSFDPPVRAVAWQTAVLLQDLSTPGVFRANPTLAAGDVKVDLDGAGLTNLATLPTVTPAGGKRVAVSLSAAEMTADIVTVIFSDQTSPKEWADFGFAILTTGAAILVDAAGRVDVGKWLGALPNILQGGKVDAFVAGLSSVNVTVVSPVADSGTVSIIRGDDYKDVDGRALTFTDSGGTWPGLGGGTVRLITYPPGASGLNVAGTVPNPGTSNQIAKFDLTAAQTAAAPLGGYPYHVVATLSNGDVVTLVSGTLIVTT